MREYQVLRRHALKLAYWPEGVEEEGLCADLDWDWVRSLNNMRVGELRIDQRIAGRENVRVIFFKANKRLEDDALPRIWLLTVFPKKRQEFTSNEIAAWRGMREIIIQRHYAGDSNA